MVSLISRLHGLPPSRAERCASHSLLPSLHSRMQSYFSSERSFAQLRLPDAHRAVVGFGKDPGCLLVVSSTGAFYTALFDTEKGGSCEQQSYVQWMEDPGGV